MRVKKEKDYFIKIVLERKNTKLNSHTLYES